MLTLFSILISCTLPDPIPSAKATYELSCDSVICHDPAAIGWYGDKAVTCQWACVQASAGTGELVYASYTFLVNSETGCIEVSSLWEDSENDGCQNW